MAKYKKTIEYFLADFPRTLFPLETNRILIENAADAIGDFVYKSITHEKTSAHQFLPQLRAYAAKPGFHLRRTLKLDPVAEFFFYDITYRHRSIFREARSERRQSFGYRFSQGEMVSPARSYRAFRKAVHDALDRFEYCIKIDIAQYFNSLYHHDVVAWFRDFAKTEDDAEFLGKFLRQINSGRSVDCLPHGIYPAKIIGSQFLGFLDESNRLNASQIFRFMDDIYMFDDDYGILLEDFHQVQRLLGEKNLTINSAKTQLGSVNELNIEREVDDIKARLLNRRGEVIFGSGSDEIDDDDDRDEQEDVLNEEDIEYLMDLLKDERLEEEDAELVLALMRDHSDDVLEHIPTLLRKFPTLSKNFYYFAQHVGDETAVLGFIRDFLRDSAAFVSEFQLFWLAKICENQLMAVDGVGDILALLYEHASATQLSKAKVLEIAETRFGMPDLREEELRTGASGWLPWSAAVGSRKVRKANRNHLLGYFANGSPVNRLVADCVKAL